MESVLWVGMWVGVGGWLGVGVGVGVGSVCVHGCGRVGGEVCVRAGVCMYLCSVDVKGKR